MKKAFMFVLTVIALIGLVACARPVSGEVLKSDKPRTTSPEVNQSDLSSQVDGNSAFAFDLYQQIKNKEGNLFYSPYSISLALAMTYAGARGNTEKQMADVLHFVLPQNRLHPALNALDIELGKRGEGAKGKDGEGFRLNVVNAIWGQKDYKFLNEFLDLLAVNYGAGLRLLDFMNAPEDARLTINKWVSEQTENKIKDLIPQGAINELTRLVLTNAIYFNAAWQYPFNEDATQDATFHLLNGTEITVPMMKQMESFGYTESNETQAVELMYDGGELSMVILLPKAGQFTAFENALTLQQVKGIINNLKQKEVRLSMPKFEYESEFGLKEALSQMGMTDAFDDTKADFSGMTGNRELYVTDVIHKAFVSVDEAGTEAAAATAVIVGTTSLPSEIVEVTVDRPFVFLIRDIQTGTILFLGRVLNPGS